MEALQNQFHIIKRYFYYLQNISLMRNNFITI